MLHEPPLGSRARACVARGKMSSQKNLASLQHVEEIKITTENRGFSFKTPHWFYFQFTIRHTSPVSGTGCNRLHHRLAGLAVTNSTECYSWRNRYPRPLSSCPLERPQHAQHSCPTRTGDAWNAVRSQSRYPSLTKLTLETRGELGHLSTSYAASPVFRH